MSDLRVSLIQTQLFWEDKRANRAMLEEKIFDLKEKTHIVVLPEMFTTGFSMSPQKLAEPMDGETIQWMRETAMARKVILTGSIIVEENKAYYNRLIWMLPDGNLGYYNKRHLFSYAGEEAQYTAGNKRLIASVNGWKVNLQICYDLRFPVWIRQTPQTIQERNAPEYDLLIFVANWPERRKLAWQTLLRARAIENMCYVVGVNRVGEDGNGISHSGDSMIFSPLGETIFHQEYKETVHTQLLDLQQLQDIRQQFSFWKDGDDFGLR